MQPNPAPAVAKFYAVTARAFTPRPATRFTDPAAEEARWGLLGALLALVLALHCAEARPAADPPAAPVAVAAHL